MSLLSATLTLFLVMDPLGNIPIFLGLLSDQSPQRRRTIIVREMVIALVILVAFLYAGEFVLRAMHISEPALSIGGGVVLFLIALRMIFPNRGHQDVTGSVDAGDPLIVPLAVPLVAGPSTMATIILFSTQFPGERTRWLAALVIAWAIALVVLLGGELLRRVLGRRGLAAMERLMGMILTTISVQMLLTGIEMFIVSL